MATGDLEDDFDAEFEKLAAARGQPSDAAILDDEGDDAFADGSANGQGEGGDASTAGQPDDAGANDPWKDAPPELRQMYIDMAAQKAAEEHKARSNAGRVSALQKKLDEIQEQNRSSKPGAGNGPAAQDGESADVESFAQDFPEAARFARETAEQVVKPVREALEQQQQREAADAAANARAAAIRQVAAKHPDFDQIRQSTGYATWLRSQAPGIQQLSLSGDPRDAIQLCDLFKATKPAQSGANRTRVIDAAVETPSKGAPRRVGIHEDDYDGAFEHHADRIEKRNRQHQR